MSRLKSATVDLSEVLALKEAGLPLRRHPWEMCRARLLREWLGHRTVSPARVLDVGCGDAFILDGLAAARPDLHCLGVDTAYEQPQETGSGARIFPHLDQVPPELKGPGLVTLMDVLEHIADPSAFLQGLRDQGWLVPGARVFVTVPAFQSLFGRHDELLGHYRRYNRQQLGQLLAGAGIRVDRSGYWFFLPLLVRGLEIAMERLRLGREVESGLVSWRHGPWISGLLASVLHAESRLCELLQRSLGLCVAGLTCYAECTVE